jgi:putative ABC transport system permease protein
MFNDFKYAFRTLIKTPAVTIIAVLTLALGIGANSAIFSVVDTVLLRPLAFKDPDRLVMIWGAFRQQALEKDVDSFPNYADYRDQNRTFDGIAAFTRAGAVLNASEDTERLEGLAVTPQIFQVLGVSPVLGRGYTVEEDKPDSPPVIVLSDGLWRRAFGGDPKIVGQQINVAGKSTTVLGVMPRGWKFPVQDEKIEYLMPLQQLIATEVSRRGAHFLSLVGRIKSGVSTNQAQADLVAIAARMEKEYPDTNTNRSVWVAQLHADIVAAVKPALIILLGAVALVLLIACANVANLLLARAAARSREMAIRTALGASRARIVRQLLAESLLLAVIGGGGGLVLAWWAVDVLGVVGPQALPRIGEIAIDGKVCAFTFAIAVLSTLVFGTIPALQVSRPDVNESLQQGSKGSTGGLHTNRVRAFLVVSQVSLSLLLLCGAGLLIKSFFNLRATKPGFEPTRLVTLDMSLPKARYSDEDKQRQMYEQMLLKLTSIPGVESVGGVTPLPFTGNSRGSSFSIAGQPALAPGNHPGASHLNVAPEYFATMKIPVRIGRAIDRRDTKDSAPVVMVNEAFARRFLPNTNPVGQRVIIDRDNPTPLAREVVGVVANTKHDELGEVEAPEMYVPFAQDTGRNMDVVLRVASDNPAGLEPTIRRSIKELDKDLFVPKLERMENLLANQLSQPRFNMMLLCVFAAVAMILAAVGIYGVIAYSVSQRTREIGIRMALGAQRTEMLGMVLRQSLTMVLVGIALGTVAALAATRLLGSMLYGVGANDVPTYAVVVLLLGGAALLASYIPARRAMKVDPMIALRYE